MKPNHLANKAYSFTPLLSHSEAIFYFSNTVRNVGKTWGIEKRAWRRAYKHGKKSIYVRRFRGEASKAAESLYQSRDVKEFCTGLKAYDPQTKKGNFKRIGSTFYIKRNKRWEWFLKVLPLTKFKDCRSADDVDCDTIYYDEYTTTPEKYRQYRGNEVEHFIDLCVTICRQHDIRVIFCGNKESTDNPYLKYFDITPLPDNYEGIRTYRGRTLAIEQYNTIIFDPTHFQKRLKRLLEGTTMGAFLYESKTKGTANISYKRPPKDAEGYLMLMWQGRPLRLQTKGAYFYASPNIDTTLTIFTDKTYYNLKRQRTLCKKTDRNKFAAFEKAYCNNRIIYNTPETYETVQQFAKWCGITNTG